ncbi:PHP domain-containing protein [uncultured Treponema sp.]|uniref:PHP domain-containing protein n=1 Tax=uncultured Treponema sp. TaxID=162155 RepID=UPI0025FBE425|nr:PHP domain-containing protein [uncultured Treponema sp.]
MIDLHSHSSASDGIFSPKESAEYAIQKNLKVWALTDHDTVDGLSEAAKTCAASGTEMIFVPGIEVNVRWPTGEFHLLGLGLRKYSEELRDLTADLTESRRRRNQEIVEKMNKDGIEVTLEEIEAMFSESQLGRPHFAAYLVKIGKVKRVQEAFDRFLGKGRPYHVNHEGADLDVAVEAIKSSGGIPVLAHPLSLYVSWGKMDETIEKIRNHGVAGLEAWHPAARINEGYKLEELAKKLGMFVTAGSDFHGKGVRADRHLGKTSGDRKIDDRFWFEELAPHLGDFDYRETEWCN